MNNETSKSYVDTPWDVRDGTQPSTTLTVIWHGEWKNGFKGFWRHFAEKAINLAPRQYWSIASYAEVEQTFVVPVMERKCFEQIFCEEIALLP